jgi:hypothetical protein
MTSRQVRSDALTREGDVCRSIVANGPTDENACASLITANGETSRRSYLTHPALLSAGKSAFYLSQKANW